MTGSDSQAVYTESSQAPGNTHRFQGFMNVHRGTGVSATVTVRHFVFLVFYIWCISKYKIHCITKFICRCIKIPTKYKTIEMNKILCFITSSLHYISLRTGVALRCCSNLFQSKSATVQVVRLRVVEVSAHCRFDRNTFRSYLSSTLYVSAPG